MYGCSDTFCADRHSSCKEYAMSGKCSGGGVSNPWMETNCAATCGICKCQDKVTNCASLVKHGNCPHQISGSKKMNENKLWMKQNCAKSCGICGPTDLSCQDKECVEGWSGCI